MKLKKSIVGLVAISMCFGSFLTIQGASVVKKIQAELHPDYTIVIDGEKLNLDTQYAIKYDNTTYLPLKKVADAMGKEAKWDPASKTVTLGTPAPKGHTLYDIKQTYESVYTSLTKKTEETEGGKYAYFFNYISYKLDKHATFDISKGYQTVEGKVKNFSKCPAVAIIRNQDDTILYKETIPAGGIVDFKVNIQKVTSLTLEAGITENGYQGAVSFIDVLLN